MLPNKGCKRWEKGWRDIPEKNKWPSGKPVASRYHLMQAAVTLTPAKWEETVQKDEGNVSTCKTICVSSVFSLTAKASCFSPHYTDIITWRKEKTHPVDNIFTDNLFLIEIISHHSCYFPVEDLLYFYYNSHRAAAAAIIIIITRQEKQINATERLKKREKHDGRPFSSCQQNDFTTRNGK